MTHTPHPNGGDADATPHPTIDALGDFCDGASSAAERDAVARHVRVCAACAAELRAMQVLLQRAAALPCELDPPAELWESVHARLAPRASAEQRDLPRAPRVVWSLAAAAVLLLVVGSTLSTRAARTPMGTGAVSSPALAADLGRAEAEYVRAAAELRAALDTQRSALSPETVATVEQSLRVVDAAIVEARLALVRDPGNVVIADVLSANHEQKLDLLRRATRLLPPS